MRETFKRSHERSYIRRRLFFTRKLVLHLVSFWKRARSDMSNKASTWCIRPQFSRVECIGSLYHHTYLLLHLALEEIHNQRFFHQDEHLSQKHTLLFPSCVSAVIPPCKVPPDLHRLWRHHNPLGSHLGGKAISYNRCVIRTGWLAFERSF